VGCGVAQTTSAELWGTVLHDPWLGVHARTDSGVLLPDGIMDVVDDPLSYGKQCQALT